MPHRLRAELVLDARAMTGEGPLWDPRQEALWWVDIPAGALHRYDPSTGVDDVRELDRPLGCLGLGKDGGLVLGLRDGFGILVSGRGELDSFVPLAEEPEGNRLNEGRVDPRGRFWAGSMALDHTPRAGSLYRLESRDGSHLATRVLDGLSIANGLDWSDDCRRLYYIDSPTQRVDVFDFEPAGGNLSGRRVLFEIPEPEGLPDGMVMDADGCLWVALFGAGLVRRYRLDGAVDLEVEVETSLTTSMGFGGPDLRDLYITTARHRLTPEQAAAQPRAGGLFVCRPGPQGRPPNLFLGA